MSTVRKLLLAVLLVSLTGSAFGAGTFASFNASTTNPGSSFATGSVVLTNSKAGGTGTCFSTNTGVGASTFVTDTNANATCDSLFSTTVAKPGDVATADLTLTNVGSLPATTLQGVVSACTTAFTGTYHGSDHSKICGAANGLKIQVQEMTSNTFATPVAKCVYPVNASLACSTYDYIGNGFAGATFSTWNVAGMAATSGAKYLRIRIQFPDNGTGTVSGVTDNAYQGLQASFSVVWTIAQ